MQVLDSESPLPGYYPANFECDNSNDGDRIDTASGGYLQEGDRPIFQVRDARANQGGTDRKTSGAFFKNKGFSLMEHLTSVLQWNEDYFKGTACMGMVKLSGSDISNKYAPEVEEIIRNVLLPEYNIIEAECYNAVLRRGPGSQNNFFGSGVHQDYGLSLEDYRRNLVAWDKSGGYMVKAFDKKWGRPEVKGVMMINFWRPILNYTKEKPLRRKPLAVCDPASVTTADTVHTGLQPYTVGGSKGVLSDQMALKYNAQHEWYYYPHMTNDEVLIFKQFEYWKGDETDRTKLPVRGVFHTAFEAANTPENEPPRTSCEYRVCVYLGDKKTPQEAKELWTPPAPLFPKSDKEWAMAGLDCGIFGLLSGLNGECPGIPDAKGFIIAFMCVTGPLNFLKHYFSMDRPGHKSRYPVIKAIMDILGVAQLGIGIWGISVMAPKLGYLSDGLNKETCESGTFVSALIPSAIIFVVLVGLVGALIYYLVTGVNVLEKKDSSPESASLLDKDDFVTTVHTEI